jgi:NTP pyrophosphatase (non-canonical NTP hydrolase)
MANGEGPRSLKDYQALIKQLVVKRGFDSESISDVFMLFLEEAGEFAKAARKTAGIALDKNSQVYSVEEEAADVFWLLIDLCNRLNIDLQKAFDDKEIKNNTRKWSV